jgi:F-type H+-transporting ATPase subunit delta
MQDYKNIFYRKKNICPVLVKTVAELSDAQKKKLTSAMEKYTGKKVVVDYQIRPELLGGLLIECDSKVIDDSIKGKIDRLTLLMKGAE